MNNVKFDRRKIGPVLFIAVTGWLLYLAVSNTPTVLILHSYNVDYIWTNLIDAELEDGLRKRPHIKSQFFYMNSKRTYNKATESSTHKVIQRYSPDIIIAFDDNAQVFLSKYYLDSDIKIVFAGVNGKVHKYNYIDNDNITGIFERKPIDGILFVLSTLNNFYKTPKHTNVTLLGDKTTSSKQDVEYLLTKDWKDFKFTNKFVKRFSEWKTFILSLEKLKTHHLLVSGYRKLLEDDRGGVKNTTRYVHHDEVVKWTLANTKIPILGLNIFAAADGLPLSIGASPTEQAEVALNLVDKILSGTKPGALTYRYPEYYNIGINETALRNSNFSVPKFFKSFAGSSHNIYQ